MYIGPIYVGEKRQKIDVVWDTGSDWLVIANSKCKTCDGPNPFVRKDSSTFTQLGEKKLLAYGSALCKGALVQDIVCSEADDPNSCVLMQWILMNYQEGFEGTDGIAGLSTGLGTQKSGPLVV